MSKSVRIAVPSKSKLEGEAKSLQTDLRDKTHLVSDAGTYQTSRGRASGANNEFPAQYFPDTSEEDARIRMKSELMENERPLGDAMLTDRDIDYFLEKERTKELIAFDDWYSRLFDTKDINQRRLAQEIHPEYWQKREAEIERQAQIQTKMALIKLRGPKDLDDFKFLYAIQTGDVVLRSTPIYNLDTPEAHPDKKFKKGMFNPFRQADIQEASRVPASLGRDMWGNDLTVGGRQALLTQPNNALDRAKFFARGNTKAINFGLW